EWARAASTWVVPRLMPSRDVGTAFLFSVRRSSIGEGKRKSTIPAGRREARPGRGGPSRPRALGARGQLRSAAEEERGRPAVLVLRWPDHRERRGHGRSSRLGPYV